MSAEMAKARSWMRAISSRISSLDCGSLCASSPRSIATIATSWLIPSCNSAATSFPLSFLREDQR